MDRDFATTAYTITNVMDLVRFLKKKKEKACVGPCPTCHRVRTKINELRLVVADNETSFIKTSKIAEDLTLTASLGAPYSHGRAVVAGN
jgi:hypothetical protein